ncbi:MAG TPA: hypothetical protein VF092_10510 [Longimicrobium sp.]
MNTSEYLSVLVSIIIGLGSPFSVGAAVATNYFSFVFFLLSPIVLYLAAVVVLPDFEGEGEIDLRAHYLGNRHVYSGFLAALPLLNAVRSVAISHDPLPTRERPYEAA